jgi:regulation of enolase protein 1 (concanavalin A-like superfamily)
LAEGATYAEVSLNTFIAKGAGGNIGGNSDALNFTHRTVTGDFLFTARLVSADWSGRDKIGLMVRESVVPEAKVVALTVGELGNRQCRFGTRTETSASMTWQAGNDYTVLPVWFKIQRAGDVFTGYQSVDGMNWFKVGSSTMPMTNQCLVGLAITGLRKEVRNPTVFDHVTVQNTSK